MAARGKNRRFPTAFKLKAIKRAEGGEGVLPVARKLGISRKLLHEFKARKIPHQARVLPCGHYSSGRIPFNLLDGITLCRFLDRAL